jgi:hypothetical protein
VKHNDNVVRRDVYVCLGRSEPQARIERSGSSSALTALKALSAVADSGFETGERVLWKARRGLRVSEYSTRKPLGSCAHTAVSPAF